ncbi:SDR family oxidoreductase [Actinopolyspora mortivallis]|uniref:Short chain dehydrogenase n=1 Tax=Actinopolyspora mortivallis TaxID=33906 RepID=A0A2T0GRY0_ACTMO|nr:SDR family oxidoreductase [Actinopolyspora mortivallis]PRW61859.1 short chain dehydrogenase [Actinopolyspora mortivallis]
MSTTRLVTTEDGLRLTVEEHGDPARPCVVCVHGYPDNRSLWNGVVARLSERYHVVTYDVRGAGSSDTPTDREGYRLHHLTDDLVRVVDAVSPGKGAHLLAHDWGSIQAWHTLTDRAVEGRIHSLTSISGPHLHHVAHWTRQRLRLPTPRRLSELLRQLSRSGYIGFFRLPRLPELTWRSGLLPVLMGRLDASARNRRPRVSDAVSGLELYRANMSPGGDQAHVRTTVPVQVLAPTRDAFVTPALQDELPAGVPGPRVRRVTGGHWLPARRPELVARRTAEFVDGLEDTPRHVPDPHEKGRFAGVLVVVTGAGSGIGRATALAFAAHGARVVAADVDGSAASDTARRAPTAGLVTAYTVDVSDGEAMHRFAEDVQRDHGTPDVVVNNAGVGLTGPLLDTDEADLRRVFDTNLWGVVHGCRAFAPRMIERGEAGRIVNISSAAAHVPLPGLTAYSAGKAAVSALSERLNGELAEHDIAVSAVLPGIVNTAIPTSTRFVGGTPAEQRRRRRRATGLYRLRGLHPDRVAAAVLRVVEHPTPVTAVGFEAKAGLLLSRLAPGPLRRLAATGPRVR